MKKNSFSMKKKLIMIIADISISITLNAITRTNLSMSVEKNRTVSEFEFSTGTNKLLLLVRFVLFYVRNCVVRSKVECVFMTNGKWLTCQCHVQCSTIKYNLQPQKFTCE